MKGGGPLVEGAGRWTTMLTRRIGEVGRVDGAEASMSR